MARICDKCKKIVEGNKYWDSDVRYGYHTPKRNPLKIDGQIVELKMQFVLQCGQHLDLCDSCAKKIIKQRTK